MDWSLIVGWIVALTFAFLWQRERLRASARRAMWRDALRNLREDENVSTIFAKVLAAHSDEAASVDEMRATLGFLQARQEDEQRGRRDLEDVLSSLQDAVFVVDADARLRYLNAAAAQLFEVRVQDVLGAHLLEALPTFELEAGVRAAIESGRHQAREMTLYAPRVREALLRVAPLRRGESNEVGGAVAIIQDLTELRRLERVRRDFVANASHELRTPIANIRATAETILDEPENIELARRFLPRLLSEAERLARLVNDLLNLAQAEAPRERVREPVELCALTGEVMEQLRVKAESRQIELSRECEGETRVSGDAAGLEQVVFNLLDNALMYTPEGGKIVVQATSIPPRSSTPVAILTVSDTGIGIPSAEMTRIFERFYRVDKARSRSQGGTGLGLAIVKHIVENHGGHIRVESEIGRGTTFIVTLPVAE